jgi:hypothetical protein
MATTELSDSALARALIPGAYERNTLTHRQAGTLSGPAFGSDAVPVGSSLMDAATIADREMEGGGGHRKRKTAAAPQPG